MILIILTPGSQEILMTRRMRDSVKGLIWLFNILTLNYWDIVDTDTKGLGRVSWIILILLKTNANNDGALRLCYVSCQGCANLRYKISHCVGAFRCLGFKRKCVRLINELICISTCLFVHVCVRGFGSNERQSSKVCVLSQGMKNPGRTWLCFPQYFHIGVSPFLSVFHTRRAPTDWKLFLWSTFKGE